MQEKLQKIVSSEMASAPLSPRSLNTIRNMDIHSDSNPWLKIHIVTKQTASAITERKFEKSLTIGQFKGKLELLTGCSSGSMELSIEDAKGNKIGEIKSSDNDKMLGSFQIDDGMSIRVSDPLAVDWNNLDKGIDVQKKKLYSLS